MLGATPPESAEELCYLKLSQSVFCAEYARELALAARLNGIKLKVHVKVDTGMNRLGFPWFAPEQIAASCPTEFFETSGVFTHFGLSGPLVLSASTYIEDITKHRYICEFDLKPALDEKTLYDRLTRDFAEQGSHSAQGALAKLLPNSMRPVAVEKWGIDPATKAAQITREQKQALVDLCKHWQVPVSALGDKEHAVITAGGVDVREVDPKTMASKLCAGLYFAGEVLDVDARTGGYNLQIAWSTAVAAARAL